MTGRLSNRPCLGSRSSDSTSILSTPGAHASWRTENHTNSNKHWSSTTSYRCWSACISSPRWVSFILRWPSNLTHVRIIYAKIFSAQQGMNGGWLRHYSWRCQPVDTSTSENGLRVSVNVTSNMTNSVNDSWNRPLKPYLLFFLTGSTWLLRLLYR